MSDLFPVTIESMIDEVRLELSYRRNVYGRLVRENRMNPKSADRRIEIMIALLAKLEAERDQPVARIERR